MSDTPANPNPFRLSPGDAFGFSNDGERVAATWPEYQEPPEVELLGRLKEAGAIFPDESAALEIIRADDHHQQGRADCQQIILKLIVLLTRGGTAKRVGQFAVVLAHQFQLPGFQTQSELGEKMEVTQGRVSQLINEIDKFSL